jgi:hypothetical protein
LRKGHCTDLGGFAQIDIKTYDELKKSNNSEKYFCMICNEAKSELQKLSDDESIINISTDSKDSNPPLTPTPIIYEPDIEDQEYYCSICSLKVGHSHKSVQCDLCDQWHHIKCDGIDNKTYEALKKSSE